MSGYPIPIEALDDRFGVLGTPGSGKTYMVLGAMAQLLASGARAVGVDPLGVMWGLRLDADGKTPSPYSVVIFGGKHADLPLTEHAGALIGETVATMAESCIIDLSELPTKAAERRFMVAFLEAIYRATDPDKVEPYHLIVDEADRFAPQKPPKGDEILLNRLEEIVRRGRVRGFITWLVTQRPAVLNKNVLSMVDSMVVMKLVSATDRDQIRDWVDTHGNPEEWRAMRAAFPTLQRGAGVLWMPSRGRVETVTFPENRTFDSSASPKRGQRRTMKHLKPLDVGALKDRLAAVEQEVKANDPAALKAEVARLRAEAANHVETRQNPAEIAEAEARGYARAQSEFERHLEEAFRKGCNAAAARFTRLLEPMERTLAEMRELVASSQAAKSDEAPLDPMNLPDNPALRPGPIVRLPPPLPPLARATFSEDRPAVAIKPAHQKILDALAWNENLLRRPGAALTKVALAFHVGMTASGGGFNNYLGALRSGGLIDYQDGGVVLTDAGRGLASAPQAIRNVDVQAAMLGKVKPAQQRLMEILIREYPSHVTKEWLAGQVQMEPSGGGFNNYLGSLRTLQMIDYPVKGHVRATDFLFPETAR